MGRVNRLVPDLRNSRMLAKRARYEHQPWQTNVSNEEYVEALLDHLKARCERAFEFANQTLEFLLVTE